MTIPLFLSPFSYFFVTFSLLSGRPRKSLFRYFFATLIFSGFRALWDLLLLTTLATKVVLKLSWLFPPSASAGVFYCKFYLQRVFRWESLCKILLTQFSVFNSRNSSFRMLTLFFRNPVSATKRSSFATRFPPPNALLPQPGFRHQTHVWSHQFPHLIFSNKNLGSQHPSPNVKTLCNFEPQIWPEMITSRDAESTCF